MCYILFLLYKHSLMKSTVNIIEFSGTLKPSTLISQSCSFTSGSCSLKAKPYTQFAILRAKAQEFPAEKAAFAAPICFLRFASESDTLKLMSFHFQETILLFHTRILRSQNQTLHSICHSTSENPGVSNRKGCLRSPNLFLDRKSVV